MIGYFPRSDKLCNIFWEVKTPNAFHKRGMSRTRFSLGNSSVWIQPGYWDRCISVVLTILYILRLEKWFTKHQLHLLSITFLNVRRYFIFRSSPLQVFYKKVAHKNFSKFSCNLIKSEALTQVHICELGEIIAE